MIRAFEDLHIIWIDRSPWFEARELVALLQVRSTTHLTQSLYHGAKRTHRTQPQDWKFSTRITLVDSVAFIEAWIAFSSGRPSVDARTYIDQLLIAATA